MSNRGLERQKAFVEEFYRKNAENPNLTPEQHAFLRHIGTFRHEFHKQSEKFLLPGRGKDAFKKEFYEIIDQGYCMERGFDVPNEVLLAWNDLCRVQTSLREKLESCDFKVESNSTSRQLEAYIDAKEVFNEVVESYLESVDKEYGTKYRPSAIHRMSREVANELDKGRIVERHKEQIEQDKMENIKRPSYLQIIITRSYKRMLPDVDMDKQTETLPVDLMFTGNINLDLEQGESNMMFHNNEKIYNQLEMEEQLHCLAEKIRLMHSAPTNPEKFVEVLKAEVSLLVESTKWLTSHPEYMSQVAGNMAVSYDVKYENEFARQGVELPKDLLIAVNGLVDNTINNGLNWCNTDSIKESIERYSNRFSAEDYYLSNHYKKLEYNINEILEAFQQIEQRYPDVGHQLSRNDIEIMEREAREELEKNLAKYSQQTQEQTTKDLNADIGGM